MSEDSGSTTTTTDAQQGGSDDGLGDQGQKALNAERTARRNAEKAARDAQKAADDVRKELDALKAGTQTEHEKAINQAVDEAVAKTRGETLAVANGRLLAAAITAAAAGKLADPGDAIAMLDLSEFTVADDGSVDSKAISKAIDELVKEKPYLAATGRNPGKGDGGARTPASSGNWLQDAVRRRNS